MRDRRPRNFVIGLFTSAIMAVAVVGVVLGGIPGGPGVSLPWNHSLVLHAQLRTSDALSPNASVNIAGIKVGTVRSVQISGELADVTLQIDNPSSASIRSDASVLLRPHGLFGPKYIELVPGTSGQPLANGSTISVDHSTQPVDLDHVLAALQAPERQNLQTALIELGKAAASRGDDVNHLLSAANLLSQNLNSPVQTLSAVGPSVNDILIQNEAFNSEFAKTPLDQLVANNNQTLRAFADNASHLQNLLTEANLDLTQLDTALNGQSGNLRAILEAAPGAIDRLNAFNSYLALFGRNIQGQDTSMPQDGNVTSGIIAAIENPKSAFSSYDCAVQTSPCPPDQRRYYLRVQVFNLGGTGNGLNGNGFSLCSLPILTLPGTPALTNCPAGTAGGTGSPARTTSAGATSVSAFASFLAS